MELNWSTFILEIINFLILVWILKRFLYKPVMDAIATRRAGIEQEMQAASQKQQEADTLRHQYEHRLQDWEQEKQAAREQLRDEIEQERQRLHTQLQTSLAQEQEKARVNATQREQEQQHHYARQAMENSMRFTSKLLSELASADIEGRLLDRLLTQLQTLSAEQRKRLNQAFNGHNVNALVLTAYPLSESHRQQIEQAIQGLSEHPVQCEFKQDKALLAGARIQLGPWLLQANLQDDLQAFAEFEHNLPVSSVHD